MIFSLSNGHVMDNEIQEVKLLPKTITFKKSGVSRTLNKYVNLKFYFSTKNNFRIYVILFFTKIFLYTTTHPTFYTL